ncbi:MAG TPA: hypothetical protein VIY90_20280 [Steroidobacteraceae bacterium]
MVNAWHARTLPELVAVADTYANAIGRAATHGARLVVTPEGGMGATAQLRSAILAPLVLESR